MKRAICVGVALLAASSPAAAQTVDLNALIPAGGATASGRIIELVAILTVLSVAPGLLIMVTSFTRFIVALSFLRSGLGLQSAPANLVLISLALFLPDAWLLIRGQPLKEVAVLMVMHLGVASVIYCSMVLIAPARGIRSRR